VVVTKMLTCEYTERKAEVVMKIHRITRMS